MNQSDIDPGLPLIQNADLKDKVVLVRVDHNVVKKGGIKDPYRIDASIGTLFSIVERGGRLILMSHVGRPKDKKTGNIKTDADSSVDPIVDYLERKLSTRFVVPEIPADPEKGLAGFNDAARALVDDLRSRKIGGIYLPNTRWFEGEQAKGEAREKFADELAGLADVYINDAFGSWQPHASTYDVAKRLPGFAGFLMQKELVNLARVMEPKRPFLAGVAGSKYDTKIGPLNEIYKKVDRLILGGVIYNTYLCAKYGIKVAGVEESDIELARELVELDKSQGKILEMPVVVESDTLDGRVEGTYRTRKVADFKPGDEYGYFLDVGPESFDDPGVAEAMGSAKTIFINAVMGFTPHFGEGSAVFYKTIDANRDAQKLCGGGDTLQELKNLCPGVYMAALDDPNYYFFTGGGTVLKAIEKGSPYGLDSVAVLIENGGKKPA